MRKMLFLMLLLALILSTGCLKYDSRQELPPDITIEAKPPVTQESPIECKEASCLALVKEVSTTSEYWECSPSFKGANDDPQGTIYREERGDKCEPLPVPDTLCLQYKCDFDPTANTGYYIASLSCDGSRSGSGIVYPFESASVGTKFEGSTGYGSFGPTEGGGFTCNAISSEQRFEGYMTNCTSIYDGCSTCGYEGTIVGLLPQSCPAAMPIHYPFNARGFTYNPIINTSGDPGDNVIRDLQKDYPKLITLIPSSYTKDSQSSNDGASKECQSIDACKSICCNIGDNPDKADECNKCSKEHADDDIKSDMGEGTQPPAIARGLTSDKLNDKCNGLNPCVEIDRAVIGPSCISSSNIPLTFTPNKYFICRCSCTNAIYSTYKCTRATSDTEYYYTFCKKKSEKTSQGGYLYEIHNLTAGILQNILGDQNKQIPIFMIGQGPTFKDYEVAKQLCKPTNPADILIKAGNAPFVPSEVTVIEGGQICFMNKGTGQHLVYKAGLNTPIANLSSGSTLCLPTGKNTNFTAGSHTLTIDDNKVANATVKVDVPASGKSTLGIVQMSNGTPVFLYNGQLEIDPLYASGYYDTCKPTLEVKPGNLGGNIQLNINGNTQSNRESLGSLKLNVNGKTLGLLSNIIGSHTLDSGAVLDINENGVVQISGTDTQVSSSLGGITLGSLPLKPVLQVRESNGNLRTIGVFAPGEYTDTIDGNKFTFVAYMTCDNVITVSGESEPTFTPGAIVLMEGSKLCIRNAVQGSAKNFILERKMNYTPETYYPIAAKRSLYGLECCFDIPEAGVYRLTDLDHQDSQHAYVVVFPHDVMSTINMNDYSYTPLSSIAKADDYVCISNPLSAKREIKYVSDKGNKGSFLLDALSDYCTFQFTKTTESANYNFTDMLTGGQFYLSVTTGDVLNVDVTEVSFNPSNGRVKPNGQVCLNSRDSTVTIIGPVAVGTAKDLTAPISSGQKITLTPGTKSCITLSEGLYMFRNNKTNLNLLVAAANESTVFIVNGMAVPTTVNVKFPDYMSALNDPLQNSNIFQQFPSIYIINKDDADYSLFDEVTIHNTGFSTTRLELASPKVIIRNNAPQKVTLEIKSYSSPSTRTLPISNNSFAIYTYQSGDYLIEIKEGIQAPKEQIVEPTLSMEVVGSRMIGSGSVSLDVKKSSPTSFVVRSVGSKVLYLYNVTGDPKNPQEKKVPLIIRGDVEGGATKMAAEAGAMKVLGFGVQTLNGVPTSQEVMAARSMLAYDNTLPVFLYSRIGDVRVEVHNPSEDEVYPVSVGTLVNVSLASDLTKDKVSISKSDVDNSFNQGQKSWLFTMPDENITFTITEGKAKKNVNLTAVKSVRVVNMSYTSVKVDDHGTPNYLIKVHNLADMPRAVMLRPASIDKYCFTLDKTTPTKSVDIRSNDWWSTSKMMAYRRSMATGIMYNGNIINNVPEVVNHDPFFSNYLNDAKTTKVAEVTLLPNMGYKDINVKLVRQSQDTQPGAGGQGYVTLHMLSGKVVNGTQASKLLPRDLDLSPGFVSGLKNGYGSVMAYRLFTNTAQKREKDTNYYLDIPYDPSVYDTNKYAILLRRMPYGDSKTHEITRDDITTGAPDRWNGAILRRSNYKILYDLWTSNAPGQPQPGDEHHDYPTGCGRSVFIVPWNYWALPREFAYDVPVIQGIGGGGAFADYIHTSKTKEVVIPQVLGNVTRSVVPLVKYGHEIYAPRLSGTDYTNFEYINVKNKIFNPDSSNVLSFIPSNLRITTGEIIADGVGIRFAPEDKPQYTPCGMLDVSGPFTETGDIFDRYDGYDFSCNGGCSDPNKDDEVFDAKFQLRLPIISGHSPKTESVIVYNKWGTACGFGDASRSEESNCGGIASIGVPSLGNVLWCPNAPAAYGHQSHGLGPSGGTNNAGDNWNIAQVISGFCYNNDRECNINYTQIIDLSSPVNGKLTVDFIDGSYYPYDNPGCDTGGSHYVSSEIGTRRDGGIPENAFTGGMLFMIDSVRPASAYFTAETASGSTESSQGYALTETFPVSIEGEDSLTEVVCFGADTYDGIQGVLAPGGTGTYTPDIQGEYGVYDAPFYPNFKKEGSTFYHISPFATDVSGNDPKRDSLDEGLLSKVKYDIPSVSDGVRLYRNATISMDDITKGNYIADVYLYNLSITSDEYGSGREIDTVDLFVGEQLQIRNTGDENIVWYYGKLSSCDKGENKKEDIQDIIKERLKVNCSGILGSDATDSDIQNCINTPKDYSISPHDMDNYLSSLSENNPAVKKLVIKAKESVNVDTSGLQGESLKFTLDDNEQSATYLLYNPDTGKMFTVRVTRQPVNIELQINSFRPSKVSIPESGNSNLCFYNKDKVDRTINFASLSDSSSTKESLKKGEVSCKSIDYIKSHKVIDDITGKELKATSDEIGSDNVVSMLGNITAEIALPKPGFDNPALKYQLLNPYAPATPAVITTELIDVDSLSPTTSAGIAKEVEAIELTCRAEIQSTDECGKKIDIPGENVETPLTDYVDMIMKGCCCKIGEKGLPECRNADSESKCSSDETFGSCPSACCCQYNQLTRELSNCEYGVENQTTCESQGKKYTYLCPPKESPKIYKQRCISTLPFLIHLKSSEQNISTDKIDAMKATIDKVMSELNNGKLKGSGGKLDMIGFVILIDDPGVNNRGKCKLSNYLDGVANVSKYAATKYGIPSMIIGFGLNRSNNEKESCWSNTQLVEQVKQLYEEDFILMLGSGVIGMGQYCLVDTGCKPIGTGISGSDYGLFYDTKRSSTSPFEYGMFGKDVIIGVPSLRDYMLQSLSGTSGQSGTGSLNIPAGFTGTLGGQIGTGGSSGTNTGLLGGNLGLGITGNLGNLAGEGSTSEGSTVQNVYTGYSNFLQEQGISGLPAYDPSDPTSLSKFITALNNLNNIAEILNGTERKDPYARAWFDQCGKYYYEGTGQVLTEFSESDVPLGQQGNQCDPSRLMALYKKYKCE